jgi:hypothetical protein
MAGMKRMAAAAAAMALTRMRPLRWARRMRVSPAMPPARTPRMAPAPMMSRSRLARAWSMRYCSVVNSMPKVRTPARK